MELKYCERCGGLWLRPLKSNESYCEGCRAAMAAWPRIARRNKTIDNRVSRGAQENAFNAEAGETLESVVIETLLGMVETPAQIGNYVSDVREVPL